MKTLAPQGHAAAGLYIGLLVSACSSIVETGGPQGTSTTGDAGESSTSWRPPPSPPPTTGSGDATGLPPSSTSTGEPEPVDPCSFLGCDHDVPPIEWCDFFDNDCPEGEKCTLWSNDGSGWLNATRCVPVVDEPIGPGEPCQAQGDFLLSGFDDCDYASICWYLDLETGEGTCLPLCQGSESAPSCDDPNRYCSIGGDSIPAFCLPYCNPLDQSTCPEGQACYLGYDAFICAPDSSGPDDGGLFDACAYPDACDPGLSCAPADDVGLCGPRDDQCCTPWCDLAAPDCPDGTLCIPVSLPGVPAGEEVVGLCGQAPG